MSRTLLSLDDVASELGISMDANSLKEIGIPVTYFLGSDEPRVFSRDLSDWMEEKYHENRELKAA